MLASTIEGGIPEHLEDMPDALRIYHPFQEHLSTIDGVILYKDRIVIPPSLRQDCPIALHTTHHGTSAVIASVVSSVFWPCITLDITLTCHGCNHCNRMDPSQPLSPPIPPTLASYPFQCICADYFHYGGYNYLVIADHYSNWPIVERAQEGAKGLIDCLRRYFTTYGIPDELSSDSGPEFIASVTCAFLLQWSVHHRLSSVAFPHSNCRAERGVKSIKRLITNNTGPYGYLNVDKFHQAILQHRKTPDWDTKLSSAMHIFGWPIRDLIPILPGKYHPHETWHSSATAWEEALCNCHMRDMERWKEHTHQLSPLRVGDHVQLQNQTGPYPSKWDMTSLVIEVLQFNQYLVRMDGSGRATLRNHKFLKKFTSVQAREPRLTISNDLASQPQHPQPDVATASQPPLLIMNGTTPTNHIPPPEATPPSEIIPPTRTLPLKVTLDLPPKEAPIGSSGLHTLPSSTSNQDKETTPIRSMSTPPRRSMHMRGSPPWQTSGDYNMNELSN